MQNRDTDLVTSVQRHYTNVNTTLFQRCVTDEEYGKGYQVI